MSRIKGLNDKVTLRKKAISPAITVWKGAKKTERSAGKSLDNLFRIEVPAHLRSSLKTAYDAKEDNSGSGSLFVDHLNLVPAYDDELKTFDSSMAAFTASQPLLFCDRETIHTKFIKDNRNYFQPIVNNEPCPVAGTNHKCPKSCTRTGNFYFYIWELLILGCAEFARLQVHGVKDNQSIADVLDTVKLEIGAIKTSPFASDQTRSYIVYQMNRREVKSKFPIIDKATGERTDKRGTRSDWIINLTLHPIWQTRYEYYRQSQQLIAAGYQSSQKLIEQVYGETVALGRDPASSEGARECFPMSNPKGENAIAPGQSNKLQRKGLPASTSNKLNSLTDVGSRYSLPKADDSERLAEFKQELAIAYKNNSWTKDGWQAMMLDTFSTSEITDLIDLDLLKAIANSGREKEKWCEF